MGRIRFVLVGKPHSRELEDLYEEYRKKLLKFADVKVEYLKEARLPNRPTEPQIRRALDEEAETVLKTLDRTDGLVLVDIRGRSQDSQGFAKDLGNLTDRFASLFFVIGSSYGLSDNLRARADYLWKLSDLTFTHPLALLISMEQVYRAFKIIRGETYQK